MKRIFIAVTTLIFCAAALASLSAAACAAANNGLYLYEGKIYHIFFHSLIIDTQKAFTSKNRGGYNDWMTTKDEFKAILPLLHREGFVLVNLTDIAKKQADGKVVKKSIYLPRGKKPLVISVDDVNYYEYMKGDGFAERLALDDEGRVTAVVAGSGGTERFDSEGDVVPILDSFVENNPDFSLNGAKGVLAVTGYQGVFGYRTNTLAGAERAEAAVCAAAVAKRLKDTGWTLASHSYTHMQKFRDGSISLADLKKDTQKWKAEVAPIVGSTPVYITPFGCSFQPSGERLKHLTENGFYIFCPVYKEMNTIFGDTYVVNYRLNMDGYTMLRCPERMEKYFFNPSQIIDQARIKYFPQAK